MENITIGNIIAGVFIVAGNVFGLKHLRSDLKKVEVIADNHRNDIKELYGRTKDTMIAKDIAELVRQVNEPTLKIIDKNEQVLTTLSNNVVKLSLSIARLDERMKNRRDNKDD